MNSAAGKKPTWVMTLRPLRPAAIESAVFDAAVRVLLNADFDQRNLVLALQGAKIQLPEETFRTGRWLSTKPNHHRFLRACLRDGLTPEIVDAVCRFFESKSSRKKIDIEPLRRAGTAQLAELERLRRDFEESTRTEASPPGAGHDERKGRAEPVLDCHSTGDVGSPAAPHIRVEEIPAEEEVADGAPSAVGENSVFDLIDAALRRMEDAGFDGDLAGALLALDPSHQLDNQMLAGNITPTAEYIQAMCTFFGAWNNNNPDNAIDVVAIREAYVKTVVPPGVEGGRGGR